MIDRNSFQHPKVTRAFLQTTHFNYSRGWSEEKVNAYVLTVPIYRYHSMALLELRIVLYEDGVTRIDVIDSTSKGVYAPWYRHESYDRYPILKEIDSYIVKTMRSMGFERTDKNEKTHNKNRQQGMRRRVQKASL